MRSPFSSGLQNGTLSPSGVRTRGRATNVLGGMRCSSGWCGKCKARLRVAGRTRLDLGPGGQDLAVGRHALAHHGVRADAGVVTDLYRAEEHRADTDLHPVADDRPVFETSDPG